MQLIANISLLFAELPLEERFAAASRAGFDGVEMQFPYGTDPHRLRRLAGTMPVVLVNVPASDGRGGIGRATDAGQRAAFAEGLDEAVRFAEILGAGKANVLAGPPPIGQGDTITARVFSDNVARAADRLAEVGTSVVVEAINPFDVPGFWLDGLDKALRFLVGQGDPRVGLQFDLYHMARTEPDLPAAIEAAAPHIRHVQFADHPGRQEPGTGAIHFAAAFAALRRIGYDGAVSAEYRPAGATEAGMGWLDRLRPLLERPPHDA